MIVKPEIALEKVCFVILKARVFDVKEDIDIEDDASHSADDRFQAILSNSKDDPEYAELSEFINAMDVDEQAELIALAWVGRGDYEAAEYEEAVIDARQRKIPPTSEYLLGLPLLADYLATGLDTFGLSCAEIEAQHL